MTFDESEAAKAKNMSDAQLEKAKDSPWRSSKPRSWVEVSTTLRGVIKPSSGERFKMWPSAFFPFYSAQEIIFCLMTSLNQSIISKSIGQQSLHFCNFPPSLIVGSKFTFLALYYFVFESNFPSTTPRGLIFGGGDLTQGFLRYRFVGAYIWRGLFSEFYGVFIILFPESFSRFLLCRPPRPLRPPPSPLRKGYFWSFQCDLKVR